ncbi:MAG TPA: transketolase C-terminal domain-containing protein [Candidatus Paceibacterota bacterium]|nr:transketolase C-terminal domain-containing protein [Candidatus Paceibacterota bacterium]
MSLNAKYNLAFPENPADAEMVPTRDGFGKGLVRAGEQDERVVALCADLTESTRTQWFAEKFPGRFVQVGVAEQNLAVLASGMANYGKIPFITSYATFSPGRNNEQIRTTVCINNVPVKIAGSHAGVSVGPDGATHQALEDIALMRVIPRMVVVVPADAPQAQKATFAAAFNGSPTYIRLGREKMPVFTTDDTPFEIGKAQVLRDGSDVAIVACGALVYEALLAARRLADDGIECTVINNHTVKPMDARTIADAARACGAVVTAEEHQIAGGMGSAVAEVLAASGPVPVEFVGMQDRFGESGPPADLMKHFGLDADGIIQAVHRVMKRKKKSRAAKPKK